MSYSQEFFSPRLAKALGHDQFTSHRTPHVREATQTPASLVPSKRKASIEIVNPKNVVQCTPVGFRRAEISASTNQSILSSASRSCQTESFSNQDFDEALATILEEEEAIRIEAEERPEQIVISRAENAFDGVDGVFGEFDDESVQGSNGDDKRDERDYYLLEDLEEYDLLNAYHDILKDEEAVRIQAEEDAELKLDEELEDLWTEYEESAEFHDHRFDTDPYENDLCYEYIGPRTKSDTYFESRIRATEDELRNPKFQRRLCERCRSVRWFALPRMTLSERRQILEVRESPLKLQESPCKVCKLLGWIGAARAVQIDSRDGKLDFTLSMVPSHEGDTKVLSVSLDGETDQSLITAHSKLDNKRWKPPILDPETIDYGPLRRMFAHCRQVHGKSCKPELGKQLSGFRVIDCYSRKVIPAPIGCEYVALSYVWGNTSETRTQQAFPMNFSITVEDSLRVTKKLGFRYLWVDKYCINQDDQIEQHKFIQNMDEIYTKAQLTIVAAAGEDPHYGLPGVGSRPRTVQRSIQIGNIKLVQLMRPGTDTPKSSWWKRAWTYQEGVLSRRKLVFTDHQVFYVCNKMHFAESLNMHSVDPGHQRGPLAFSDPVSFKEMLLPPDQRSYVSYLRDISMRALSHDTDALNTCLGMLRATQTMHVWGIPLDDSSYSAMALCWRHDVTTQRRLGFPSWSWAGWTGGANFQNSMVHDPFVYIRLRFDNGDDQSVRRFISSGRAESAAGKPTAPKQLILAGHALEADVLRDEWPVDITDFGTGAVVHRDERPRPRFSLNIGGAAVTATLYLNQSMDSAEDLVDVIAMGVQEGGAECCVSTLLLKPTAVFSVYTRVGMLQLTCERPVCRGTPRHHLFWKKVAQPRHVFVA